MTVAKKPRYYEVITREGAVTIAAHFMFDDDNGGILFRRYISDNPRLKTEIVGKFATGYWLSVREVKNDEEELKNGEE